MEVYEAIRTKHATRQFADQPVPDEAIRRILNAGRRAQSSKNTQPWHFVVVRDRVALGQLADRGIYATHLAGAAFAVAFVSPDTATQWSIAFDLGQAAAYMQLAARELGVGSCIASIYEPDKARAILGIPKNMHCDVAISFGYPLPDARKPDVLKRGGRRPLGEVAHWERWRSAA